MAGGDGQLDDQAAAAFGMRARGYWSQCREILLRVITHNVMIVRRIKVFYRANQTTLAGYLVGWGTPSLCPGSTPCIFLCNIIENDSSGVPPRKSGTPCVRVGLGLRKIAGAVR